MGCGLNQARLGRDRVPGCGPSAHPADLAVLSTQSKVGKPAGMNIVDTPDMPCYYQVAMKQINVPKTLLECSRYFAGDPAIAVEFLAAMRWKDGVECPHCKSKAAHSYLKTRHIWKCRECKKQFSVKAGTVFEDSPIALDKWMMVVWLVVNCKNGVSSWEIHRDLKVTQK